MTISESIPIYLQYCRQQKRLDAKTQKAYRIDLTQLSERLQNVSPENITAKQLESIFAGWHETYKPKTVKRKIAAAKAFFQWMSEQEYIKKNPFEKIHTKFREPKTLPKTIPEHNLERFLQAIYDADSQARTKTQKKNAIRDIAVIETLFASGMRVSELCQLTEADVNREEMELRIHGKGRKERIIPIPDLQAILRHYYENWENEIRSTHRFFLNRNGQPLSDQSVRHLINKYAEKAGIAQHITPHMFRHTFATGLLESDVNLRCIQELLGHSCIQTTEIYTHVSAAKKRQILTENHPRRNLHVQTSL